ncbi:PTS transporter subunit IIC [Sporolactobacillus terrae]|nr:PTS transporter subunit IIC [Sporolactobacillus terrae]BBN99878.1 PTS glucitol transporter subunit IIA [Sporolactobacillus terrae]
MVVEKINQGFQFFINLGAPAMMFIIITLLSLIVGVSISKALEGGIRMAVALTGMSAVISLLTSAFGPALRSFVEETGATLEITDLGWAPLAVITWGSMYTLYFAFVCFLLNFILLIFSVTKTLNVDLFNIWNISIIGLLILHYSGGNIILTTVFVAGVYTLALINADVMKPTINELLNYEKTNITTTAHPELLIAPVVMIFNKLIDRFLPFIDKFDFNAETLNRKIGFWGSKFAIGAYLGVFIGLLARQSPSEIFRLAFIAGVSLELFAYVGGWFGPAIDPLSQGITTFMSKRLRGRKLFIGIDWPILAPRAELWAVANILAPILLIVALILPGNHVLPLGGILMTVLAPALLIITKGRVVRMTIIGTVMIPLFLWAATMIAEFLTSTSKAMGNFPTGLAKGSLFSSVDSDPLEKMLTVLVGKAAATLDPKLILFALLAIVGYILMFIWYFKQMKKESLKVNHSEERSAEENTVTQ